MKERRIFALGFFDGVHLGHQALLAKCAALARETEAATAAMTFDKHPMALFTDRIPPLISSPEDRRRLLTHYGMGQVLTLPVTRPVMGTPWQDFLEGLVARGAAGFVCGDDFRFGAGGMGDGEKLTAFCRERGLPAAIVPEQTLDGVRVSSTHIRRQLEDGDMATAVRFLGHPQLLTGTVVSGRHLGRTLGIPTANLHFPQGLLVPRFGVYACMAHTPAGTFPAVTNVGIRPTVGGHHVTAEPWLLDFEGDLYGREITLAFYRFLRPERQFPSLEALREEILKNAGEVREFFGNP